ncbi:MAG: AfsR/SARP family transcriptional regulator [Micromonosporaceae bacterium]
MRFEVLGPLRAWVESVEVALPRRERVLLAVLLLHPGQSVSRQRIVDAIWGERPPVDAVGQVHASVYRLRKRLAEAGGPAGLVVTDSAGYRLRVEPGTVDLVEFRRLRDSARAAAAGRQQAQARDEYRAGLGLWRGAALDGVDSEVVRRAAVVLEEERLQVVEECVEIELSLGRAGEVVAELTELAGRHPHREGLQRVLMLALYRAGRQADALAAYRRARQLLHEELGIEPGDELQRLHQAILTRDPELDLPAVAPQPGAAEPARVQVPRELPGDVAGFTGRADALKTLDQLIGDVSGDAPAPVVISAIAGTAGVGKPALGL